MKNLLKGTAAVFAAIGLLASSALMVPTVAQEEPNYLQRSTQFFVGVYEFVDDAGDFTGERLFYYQGQIGLNSEQVLRDAFELYPEVDLISLNSPGGVATAGTDLGGLFSDEKIRVWVPKGRFCLSACANAFIGGHDYDIDGILGFHSAWLPPEAFDEGMSNELFNEYYRVGQFSGMLDSYYWIVNGFNLEIVADIHNNTNPDRFLVFKSEEELLEYYVRNDDDKEAEKVGQLKRYLSFEGIDPEVLGGTALHDYVLMQLTEMEANRDELRTARLIDTIYDGMEDTE